MSDGILWIKARMPGAVSDGSSLVSNGLVSCFQSTEPVDLVCCRLTGREDERAHMASSPFRRVWVIDPDNAGSTFRRAAYRGVYEFRSLCSGAPRAVFYETGRGMRAAVREALAHGRYRRIVAEYSTVAPLLADVHDRATLVLHDADHLTLEEQAARERSYLSAAMLRHQAAQVRRYVPRITTGMNRVLTLTEFDAEAYRELGVRRVESISVPMPDLPAVIPALEGQTLVFLGSVDYPPNRDAVAWFLADIFPAVLQRFPDARLAVVGGGNRDGTVPLPQSNNVVFLGRLTDEAFVRQIQAAAVGIAPLRLGTGIKVKVLDMLWHGLPVVTTSLAARGTAAAAQGCAMIADDARAFVLAVCDLLDSHRRRAELQLAARAEMSRRHASPQARARVRAQILGE